MHKPSLNKKNRLVLIIISLICFISIPPGTIPNANAGDIIIIVNPNLPIKTLPAYKLRKIFLGEVKLWKNKKKIVPVMSKDRALSKAFLKKFIGKTPSQFRLFWINKVFVGEGKTPFKLHGESQVVNFVKSTNGAIGYVSSNIDTDGLTVIEIVD